ncbi:ZmpA/ZmpB/ZmpC family metallo-endopeptidase [Streptococcus pneumoniae]
MWEKQRKFSIRKLAIGTVSTVIGVSLMGGAFAMTSYADEAGTLEIEQQQKADFSSTTSTETNSDHIVEERNVSLQTSVSTPVYTATQTVPVVSATEKVANPNTAQVVTNEQTSQTVERHDGENEQRAVAESIKNEDATTLSRTEKPTYPVDAAENSQKVKLDLDKGDITNQGATAFKVRHSLDETRESRAVATRDGKTRTLAADEVSRASQTDRVRKQNGTRIDSQSNPISASVEKVTRVVIPHGRRVEQDPNLWVGTSRTVQGRNGEKLVTTVYETIRGRRTFKILSRKETITKPAVDTIIYRGTKPIYGNVMEVTKVSLAHGSRTEQDPNLWEGTSRVVQGSDGERSIVTVYRTIRGVKTSRILSRKETITKPAVDTIIYRGTKPIYGNVTEVSKVSLAHGSRTERDPNLWEGTSRVVQGSDGEKTITTVYETIKGVKTSKVISKQEAIDKPAVDTIIYRGTKVGVKPTLTISGVETDVAQKSATIQYQLTDQTATYLSAKAFLMQVGKKVQEVDLVNNQASFSHLEYNVPYTVLTTVTYAHRDGNKTEEIQARRDIELEYKKIELKDIESVELYSRVNNVERLHQTLDRLPSSVDNYFVKVKSSKFKEMLLPVSTITQVNQKGVPSFKVGISFDELVEDPSKRLNYQDGYHFYVRKSNTRQKLSAQENRYQVSYSSLKNATANRVTAYENVEKLLPFYNKDLIVRYGNQVALKSKLYTTKLIDVVPMKDKEIALNIHGNKEKINRLMLHYADGTVDYMSLAYKGDFASGKVAEYHLGDTGLLYTPEVFLSDYQNVLGKVLPTFTSLTYRSDIVKNALGIPASVTEEVIATRKNELEAAKKRNPALVIPSDAELRTNLIEERLSLMFLEDSFNEVKSNLSDQLQKVLSMDKAINTLGNVVADSLVQKISSNNVAVLLGLSYLNRWYDINYGDVNTKDLTSFKLDFFGNQNVSTLDTIISLGKLGYEQLRAANNVDGYANTLGRVNGKADIFNLVESYRERFLPKKNNNEWLKENTKAYIVEATSQLPEVRVRQEVAYGNKENTDSLGIYDQLVRPSWNYKNMLLPLLTMKKESVYIISTINSLSFGGYERYRGNLTDEAIAEIRAMVDQAAIWQRDHYDFYYKILNEESRGRLFNNYPVYDGFNYFKPDGSKEWASLVGNYDSMKDFFGPVGKYYGNNGSGAYASGSYVHFVYSRLLDESGSSVFTHEMVHNNDRKVYFNNYGRRDGQGAELYAYGLLQAPMSKDAGHLALNTLFAYDKDAENRFHAANPVERFKNVDDLNQYVKGMMDLVYVLDYVEGNALVKQSDTVKKQWLRKIENYYIKDSKYQKDTHAGNSIRGLTDEEVVQLTSFESLIDNSIMTRRLGFQDGEVKRNGYYLISLTSPIYSALDNPNGAPGDLMFRRMAYELFAAKGYYGGFVPYVSNQYADAAFAAGSKTWSSHLKKDQGLVTDTIVLEKVFGGKYKNWTDFKKAMYQERIDKLVDLKPVTIRYELGRLNSNKTVTITSFEQLQSMIEDAMAFDVRNDASLKRATLNSNPVASWVNILKQKVYNAYLRSTDDFKESIFN